MNTTRIAIYDERDDATEAVRQLESAGFAPQSITLVAPQLDDDLPASDPLAACTRETRAGREAGSAAGVGGLLGGGLALASSSIYGAGVAFALPVMLGGAVFGALIGAMLTRSAENEMTRFHAHALREGQILVGVELAEDDGRLAGAERALKRAGAEPVALTAA